MQVTKVWFLVGRICWRRDGLPTPVFSGSPGGSAGKESACSADTWVWSLGWEDPLEKGKATHSSVLVWRISWTVSSMGSQRVSNRLSTFHFQINFRGFPCGSVVKNLPAMQETQVQSLEILLEKEMAIHSNILAWRIPWTEEPGGLLQPMLLRRFGYNWATNTFTVR